MLTLVLGTYNKCFYSVPFLGWAPNRELSLALCIMYSLFSFRCLALGNDIGLWFRKYGVKITKPYCLLVCHWKITLTCKGLTCYIYIYIYIYIYNYVVVIMIWLLSVLYSDSGIIYTLATKRAFYLTESVDLK